MNIPEELQAQFLHMEGKKFTQTPDAKRQTLAFTGHRPGHGGMPEYDKDRWQSIVDSMVPVLRQYAVEKGIRNFVTGGAQGVDQAMFWAVDKLKRSGTLPEGVQVKNTLFIPFIGQHTRWNEDNSIFSQKQYMQMIRHADNVVVCGKSDGSYKSAAAALTGRNQCMLDVSGTIIAFDNSHNPDGGTGDMVRRTRNAGIQLDFAHYSSDRCPVVTEIQHDGDTTQTPDDELEFN